MAGKNELHTAEAMLKKLLETQPHLLEAKAIGNGASVARFCIDFIEAYAEHVGKREQAS